MTQEDKPLPSGGRVVGNQSPPVSNPQELGPAVVSPLANCLKKTRNARIKEWNPKRGIIMRNQ